MFNVSNAITSRDKPNRYLMTKSNGVGSLTLRNYKVVKVVCESQRINIPI